MEAQLLAFAGVAAVLTVTPGADMALVTRNALARGHAAAVRTALGITAGLLTWATASALGVAALLEASTTAFNVLKLVGAGYLAWLGLQAIRRAGRQGEGDTARRAGGPFRQGLLTNLLNPKIAVFYSTLLPQFLSPGDPVLVTSLLLASIHGVLSVAWLSGYGWAVTRAGDVLRRPPVRRALDRLTGGVLIAFGARLALERR